jgi:hypothetical protein
MIRIPKVTMTMRDLDRLKCIQGLIDGQLKQTAVATRLGRYSHAVAAILQTASNLHRPADTLSAADLRNLS